jgi:hypothetical protein
VVPAGRGAEGQSLRHAEVRHPTRHEVAASSKQQRPGQERNGLGSALKKQKEMAAGQLPIGIGPLGRTFRPALILNCQGVDSGQFKRFFFFKSASFWCFLLTAHKRIKNSGGKKRRGRGGAVAPGSVREHSACSL